MNDPPQLVDLRKDSDPPNAGQWIMLVVDDEQHGVEIKRHARGFTVMAPPVMEASATDIAVVTARREHIPTIYIRRDANSAAG